MLVIGPRKIYEELFEKNKKHSHALQNLSLCGRKVVSWSDKINFNDVAKICKKNRITPNEVFFSAASSALYTFLDEYKTPIPKNLNACARYVERDNLLGKTNYSDGMYLLLVKLFTFVKLPLLKLIFNKSFLVFDKRFTSKAVRLQWYLLKNLLFR